MIGSWLSIVPVVTSLLSALVAANSPPKINAVAHGHKLVKAGTDVRLLCPVDDQTDIMFEWKKGTEIINHGWERFRVTQKGLLKIKSVSVEDSGRYECEAVNGFGEATIYITLIVTDDSKDPDNAISNGVGQKPKFDDLDKMQRKSNFARPLGSSVRFKCKASGDPQPKVIWLKGDEVVQETELQNNHKAHYTLKLGDIQASDSGDYTCYVHNKVGSINYTFSLEVIERITGKPEILPPHPTNITVKYGSTASFQCRVTSMVVPHMKWLKKIDPNMHPKPNHTFNLEGHELMVLKSDAATIIGKNVYLSKLIMRRVTTKDSGMYICICLGANSHGVNHKSAFLTVTPPSTGPHNKAPRPTHHNTQDQSTSSSSLILQIAIPTLAFLMIISLLIYLYLHRRKRSADTSKRAPSSPDSSQTPPRVPLPAPDKNCYTAVGPQSSQQQMQQQMQHMYQAPRDKFTAMVYSKPCNSTDIYSDISSVSQSRYSPHGAGGHSNGGAPHVYTHLMQHIPPQSHYPQQQQQLHYNF